MLSVCVFVVVTASVNVFAEISFSRGVSVHLSVSTCVCYIVFAFPCFDIILCVCVPIQVMMC